MPISHPFRLDESGAVAVVDEGSTRANAEAVAVLGGTILGERPMVPGFGVHDPAFAELDATDLNLGLAEFGPPGVTVTRTTTTYAADGIATIDVEFDEDDDDAGESDDPADEPMEGDA